MNRRSQDVDNRTVLYCSRLFKDITRRLKSVFKMPKSKNFMYASIKLSYLVRNLMKIEKQ